MVASFGAAREDVALFCDGTASSVPKRKRRGCATGVCSIEVGDEMGQMGWLEGKRRRAPPLWYAPM